jgi:hypothetical protein
MGYRWREKRNGGIEAAVSVEKGHLLLIAGYFETSKNYLFISHSPPHTADHVEKLVVEQQSVSGVT